MKQIPTKEKKIILDSGKINQTPQNIPKSYSVSIDSFSTNKLRLKN